MRWWTSGHEPGQRQSGGARRRGGVSATVLRFSFGLLGLEACPASLPALAGANIRRKWPPAPVEPVDGASPNAGYISPKVTGYSCCVIAVGGSMLKRMMGMVAGTFLLA